jgi:hypothetical protein
LDQGRAEPKNVEAAKQILDYFLRNPEAADSLTGIARWRLMEDFVQRSVETTQAALDWLVAEGYVEEVTRRGVGPLFHLNSDRRTAAELFMRPSTQARGEANDASSRTGVKS